MQIEQIAWSEQTRSNAIRLSIEASHTYIQIAPEAKIPVANC